MRILKSWSMVCCLVLLTWQPSFGSGFGSSRWSAGGSVPAGPLLGGADDPSAIGAPLTGVIQQGGLRLRTGATLFDPLVDARACNQWSSMDEIALWMPSQCNAPWKADDEAKLTDIDPEILSLGFFDHARIGRIMDDPDSLSFGVEVYPIENLSLEIGSEYRLESADDELSIAHLDPVIDYKGLHASRYSLDKNTNDAWRFSIGVEYAAMDWVDLRLGYAYDQASVPDETIGYGLPDSDRHRLSSGLGVHWDSWAVDVMYRYLKTLGRDIDARLADRDLEGETADGTAHTLGLSVGYTF